jgi:hypothetical protein
LERWNDSRLFGVPHTQSPQRKRGQNSREKGRGEEEVGGIEGRGQRSKEEMERRKQIWFISPKERRINRARRGTQYLPDIEDINCPSSSNVGYFPLYCTHHCHQHTEIKHQMSSL